MYAHIVVALDDSVLAEQILPRVIALAEKFGSAIHLMRAIPAAPKVAAVVDASLARVSLDPALVEETVDTEGTEAEVAAKYLATLEPISGDVD